MSTASCDSHSGGFCPAAATHCTPFHSEGPSVADFLATVSDVTITQSKPPSALTTSTSVSTTISTSPTSATHGLPSTNLHATAVSTSASSAQTSHATEGHLRGTRHLRSGGFSPTVASPAPSPTTMGHLQALQYPSSSDTNSSDNFEYYEPNGVIENALRRHVDAWNAQASLWDIDTVRDDWNHWCVPAVRQKLHTTIGWGWQQCHQAAVEICNGVWNSWSGARYHSQQRLSAMLLRNPQEWEIFMIEQTQRLTRVRRQLEQMGRVNCLIGDPTRISSSAEQSLLAIERTRLGGPLPRPAHPVPVPADAQPRPMGGHVSPQDEDTQGPHDEAAAPTHQEAGRFTSADEAMQHEDGQGSDSTSLYQTAIILGRQERTSSRATNTNYDACGRTSNRLAPIMSHGSSSQAGRHLPPAQWRLQPHCCAAGPPQHPRVRPCPQNSWHCDRSSVLQGRARRRPSVLAPYGHPSTSPPLCRGVGARRRPPRPVLGMARRLRPIRPSDAPPAKI